MALKLTAEEVERAIRGGLPGAQRSALRVEEVREGYARVRLPFHERMLRPGNSISGPTLFAAADTAMYALVMAHVGPQLMAVTASMNLNFLLRPRPGDVIGEATLLKLGRRLVVMEAALFTSAGPERVAHVTGTYALPADPAAGALPPAALA
jgi:uncharacterized protein (TIGR00369 family)